MTDTCRICGWVNEYTSNAQKPKRCNRCNSAYWSKPTDERVLFESQDAFVESGRDPQLLGPMYLPLLRYSKNIIKNALRNKKHYTTEALNEKAEQLALTVVEKYLRSSEFVISHSFGGYLRQVVKGVIYTTQKEDQTLSFDLLNSRPSSNDPTMVEDVSTSNDYILFFIRYILTLLEGDPSRRFLFLLGMKFSLQHRYRLFLSEFSSRYLSEEQRRSIEMTKRIIHSFLTTGDIDTMEILPLTLARQEMFEEKIFDLFSSVQGKKRSNPILETLRLVLQSEHDKPIIDLFYLLGVENAMSVIALFENLTITFPSQDELRENILTALVYYYREVEGKEWKEIKSMLPVKFSSIAYAHKVKRLDKYILRTMQRVLTEEERGDDD